MQTARGGATHLRHHLRSSQGGTLPEPGSQPTPTPGKSGHSQGERPTADRKQTVFRSRSGRLPQARGNIQKLHRSTFTQARTTCGEPRQAAEVVFVLQSRATAHVAAGPELSGCAHKHAHSGLRAHARTGRALHMACT